MKYAQTAHNIYRTIRKLFTLCAIGAKIFWGNSIKNICNHNILPKMDKSCMFSLS